MYVKTEAYATVRARPNDVVVIVDLGPLYLAPKRTLAKTRR